MTKQKSKVKKNSQKEINNVERDIIFVKDLKTEKFGDLKLLQSPPKIFEQKWKKLSNLEENIDKMVWLRLRVHRVRKKSNKMAFFVFREKLDSVQGVLVENKEEDITRDMVKYCAKIPPESIVDVFGKVKRSDFEIKSTTLSKIELELFKIFVVSASEANLPFQLDNASNKFKDDQENNKQSISVHRAFRLDHRFIDVRIAASQAIFKLQSAVCNFFRQFLLENDFIEIHTPKIVPGVSEGGADVYKLNYFNKTACLAQSPQLYKQMAISCDLGRVFEIGPVFRAENTNTHRHLTEFVGMDFEMPILKDYFEIIEMSGKLLVSIFDGLNEKFSREINVALEKSESSKFVYLRETLKITFNEAVQMLRQKGEEFKAEGKSEKEIEEIGCVVDSMKDFSAFNEKMLGKLIKEKYNTDFYIVYGYPKEARPFYTMPSAENKNLTNSFDIFMRGEEITSGAQRIHDIQLLKERAKECEISEESLKSYLDSFRFGIEPHGGIGIGLERVVMLFLGIDNIRECSLFPRDPKRLCP